MKNLIIDSKCDKIISSYKKDTSYLKTFIVRYKYLCNVDTIKDNLRDKGMILYDIEFEKT